MDHIDYYRVLIMANTGVPQNQIFFGDFSKKIVGHATESDPNAVPIWHGF